MTEQNADQHGRSGGELIAFTPARSENYVGGFIRGLRQQAEEAGFAVSIFENEFDQAQQDRQVRRQIESGARPDMWLWWPVDADAALDSLKALHDTGIPVLQINQLPSEEARRYVVGFVGPDDVLRAKNAAMLIGEARRALRETGKELGGDGGNILAVTYPRSYGGYSLCMPAFRDAVEERGMTVVHEVEAGFGASRGYTATKRALAGLNEEIDFVYGMDDALLQGAIRAFEEAGYHVGVPDESDVDVVAVGTVANGDRVLMLDGRQYGTTLQAPLLEGQLAIQVADEYLTTGAVETFANFTPNPAVRYSEFASFTLEGFDGETYSMDELAAWQHARQAGSAAATDAPLLRMRAINRSFGNIEALKEVSFELRRGEVMALVGENGAGKSTLVKVIAGFDHGYTGTIELDGEAVEFATPAQAEEAGIAIAQQELSLIPTMTVAENVFLADPREPNWSSIGRLAKKAKPYLDLVGLDTLDPTTRVDRLSVGEQQLVEVARLAAREAQLLILDEPTAALGEAESRRVMDMCKSLAEAGKAVVYVSHRLDEIFAIADRVTVMRDGRSQEAVPISILSVDTLIERMLGRTLEDMFPARKAELGEGDVVMEIEELWADGLVEPVSLKVRAGEILGLAGQIGSGAGYLMAAMAGARRSRGGTLHLGGKAFLPKSPREAIHRGIAYCSDDRKKDGLFLERAIRENFSSPALGRVSTFGWIQRGKELRLADELAGDFMVDQTRLNDDAETLSGGNQQKVAVGKWMSINPSVVLINEPTRGVDVGARAEIYQRLRNLADRGVAVVFASTDIQEVTFLPDRIATFYRGQLIDIFEAEGVDSAKILRDITHPYGDEFEEVAA